jgi:hypothetical protein
MTPQPRSVIERSNARISVADGLSTLPSWASALAAAIGLILFIGRDSRNIPFGPPPPSGRLLTVQDGIAPALHPRLYLVRRGDHEVLLSTGGRSKVVSGWLDGPMSP